jgi:hypothetical protein
LGHWNLFVIWDLLFGIYRISKPTTPLLQHSNDGVLETTN